MKRSVCFIAIGALMISVASAQTPPRAGGSIDPALIEDLVAANRILAAEGIFDAYGHVSMRHPGNPNRYLMSRSLAPESVTPDDIMEYDLDSNPIDPRGRASVNERFIHGEIYKLRPDVKAVVHSHSPAVIPFSVTQVPLKPVLHVASFLWAGVPVFEIRDAGGPATRLLVENNTLGKALAMTLGDKPVALMRGHGDVVAGPDIPITVRYAIYTDLNARLQATALDLGGPINYVSAEEGAIKDKTPPDRRAWELWRAKGLEGLKHSSATKP